MAVLQLGGFALWLRSLKTKNVSVVDIYWGLGFAIVAIVSGLGVWLNIFPSESSAVQNGSNEVVGGLSLTQVGLACMVVLWERDWRPILQFAMAASQKTTAMRRCEKTGVIVLNCEACSRYLSCSRF